MYEDFFGFDRKPFNVTPDPDFIYYSDQHKEALAHMLYGVQERRGFILVTGRVGSGKTTLCRAFMRELGNDTSTALILNSKMEPTELLETIAEDFGIELPEDPSHKDIIDALNDFVLDEYENGRNACVIVDEAQNLSPEALEQLRLLSNLETEKEKLLQIVLSGQPELENILNRSELRQLKQRIAVKSYLTNLEEDETWEYVQHRISMAGDEELRIEIDTDVYPQLYEATGGNPRAINLIGDRMLMAAYIDESHRVEPRHIDEAIDDLSEEVPETEDRNSRVLHRVLSNQESSRLKLLSYFKSLGNSLTGPVAIGAAAAVVTVLLGVVGLNLTNPFSGGISVPAIEGPSETEVNSMADSAVLTDTPVQNRSDTANKTTSVEVQPDTNTDTTPEASSAPGEATDVQSEADNPSGSASPDTPGNPEPAVEESEPEPPAETATGPKIFRQSNYLRTQQVTSDTVLNPLGVKSLDSPDELTPNALNRSLVMGIARYLSYYVAKNEASLNDVDINTLESIDPETSGQRILGEVLSVQALPLNGSRGELLRYRLPAFLQVRHEGLERYVLYLPDEMALWDPVQGWLKSPQYFLPETWSGFGFVLGQASFDMTRLMEYGLTGPRVLALQELLNGAGDYDIPRIDRFGPKTRSSLEDFQRRAGLPVDGVAGPETYLSLLKANNRSITISRSELKTVLEGISGGEKNVADKGSSGQSTEEDDWNVF